jgi:fumarylacetoacetase
MSTLNTLPNFGVPGHRPLHAFTPGDDFYEALIQTHQGLSDEQSRLVNARLILLLANHVGDLGVLHADFPIQNLPFGRFKRAGSAEEPCASAWPSATRCWTCVRSPAGSAPGLPRWHALLAPLAAGDLNALMALGPRRRRDAARALSQGWTGRQRPAGPFWRPAWCRRPRPNCCLPCRIGDYTDFYTSVHHATNGGQAVQARQPAAAQLQVGAHRLPRPLLVHRGQRHAFKRRPVGQTQAARRRRAGARPSRGWTIELELGAFVGRPTRWASRCRWPGGGPHLRPGAVQRLVGARHPGLGIPAARPLPVQELRQHDSPWIVTMEALAPFRAPFSRPRRPAAAALPGLAADNRAQGAIDIQLAGVAADTLMREAGQRRPAHAANYRHAYWTLAQLVAHHTVNGCNLQPGDLLGTGTLSGPTPEQGGSLLELSAGNSSWSTVKSAASCWTATLSPSRPLQNCHARTCQTGRRPRRWARTGGAACERRQCHAADAALGIP